MLTFFLSFRICSNMFQQRYYFTIHIRDLLCILFICRYCMCVSECNLLVTYGAHTCVVMYHWVSMNQLSNVKTHELTMLGRHYRNYMTWWGQQHKHVYPEEKLYNHFEKIEVYCIFYYITIIDCFIYAVFACCNMPNGSTSWYRDIHTIGFKWMSLE